MEPQAESSGTTPVERAVRRMADDLATLRREIAGLRPDLVSSEHVPAATDELDAVVGEAERATGEILDAAEAIEAAVTGLPETAQAAVADAVTRIYQACSFQDITGQRIQKVVVTLKSIEETVGAMVTVLDGGRAAKKQPLDTRPDAGLLNGPQLAGKGHSQAEIDALFSAPE